MPSERRRRAHLGHVIRSEDRSRHYVRLHRFRRPGDGTSGGQGRSRPAPNCSSSPLYAAAISRPQRKVVPSTQMRWRMIASLRTSATFARFMPRRLATSSAQRFRAEKRTARVSRMGAASYRAVRTITSPTRLTAPVMSVSPDWCLRGVRPKCAPTPLERANRSGASTPEVKVTATSAPTPGTVINRRQTASLRTIASMARCSLPNSTLSASRLQHGLRDPLQHRVTRDQRAYPRRELPFADLAHLEPEAAQKTPQTELHVAHLGLQLLARDQQRPNLLGGGRFAMHRPEPAHPQELGDAAGVPAIGLDDHRRERRLHVARLQQHRLKAGLDQRGLEPLRQRPGLQADARQPQIETDIV